MQDTEAPAVVNSCGAYIQSEARERERWENRVEKVRERDKQERGRRRGRGERETEVGREKRGDRGGVN